MSDIDGMNVGLRWYVAHTYSGYENKVKASLEKIIENRGLGHMIFDIRIPVETIVEKNGDEEKETEIKVFPCYVLIKMVMNDETWHAVRNITGVTGFVGPGSKPVPLTDEEMIPLGIKQDNVVVDFVEGESIRVVSGAWADTVGVIQSLNVQKQSLTINVELFGRETPVEISFADVKKL